jgi:cell division protein FtsA
LYGVRNQDMRYFKIREDNVYSKVRSRMRSWLGEIF